MIDMEKKSKLPLLLPLRSIIFLLIFLAGSAITGKDLPDIANWWSIAASAVNILVILLLIFAAKGSGSSYRELICYKKEKRNIKKLILEVFVIMSVGMSGMYLAGFICYGAMFPAKSLEIVAPVPAALAVINLLVLPLTVPFAEDGLYLGCGAGQIKNKYAAIAVPAFFYALQHCFIPTMFDAKYMLYRFISFLPLTVLLCWYFRKKKDPVPIMIGHALLDLATAAMIFGTSVIPGFFDKMEGML